MQIVSAAIVMLLLIITDVHASAINATETTIKAPIVQNNENYYLEQYNRMMHGFNQWLFAWLAPANDATDTISDIIPAPLKVGTANFMSNLINEPLTIAASLVEGDPVNALHATTRLMINTTVGLGGVIDVASRLGYPSDHRDLGLALCKYGVPSGPHVVVPLVGPRTLRDGTADVVLVNVLYLSLLASIFGTAPDLSVIIGIIFMETVGDLALLRQIDSPEMNEMNAPYTVIRDHYLSSRDSKCRHAEIK